MDTDHDVQLTASEVAAVRRLLDEDAKWHWFWANARRFGAWVFGITAALAAFREDILRILGWK